MHVFCTYFDSNYLTSGLALYRSLRRNTEKFRLYVLCMDDDTYEKMRRVDPPEVSLIHIEEVEQSNEALTGAKVDRSLVEYYFTVHSYLPSYILQTFDHDRVTYLDSDLYFYSSLNRLFEAIGDASIAVHRHRFPPSQQDLRRYGVFNAGFASFANDKLGRNCAEHWAEQAIEWCHDRVEDGKFANQKYMEEWPELFDDLVVLNHAGIGVAPWNKATHTLSIDGDSILVDGDPLVFYHFSRLRQIHPWVWWPPIDNVTGIEKGRIYRPYIRELIEIQTTLSEEYGFDGLSKNTVRNPGVVELPELSVDGFKKQGGLWIRLLKSILRRDVIVIR